MRCPNCNSQLQIINYKGIEINECSNCHGEWLDYKELDQVEDIVLSDDEMKGTLAWDKKLSNKKCPICLKPMTGFNYRLNDLYLEYCEKMHGFWLDQGEKERVIEEMKESVAKLDKKFNIEEKWSSHIKKLQSPSFFAKLKSFLG